MLLVALESIVRTYSVSSGAVETDLWLSLKTTLALQGDYRLYRRQHCSYTTIEPASMGLSWVGVNPVILPKD